MSSSEMRSLEGNRCSGVFKHLPLSGYLMHMSSRYWLLFGIHVRRVGALSHSMLMLSMHALQEASVNTFGQCPCSGHEHAFMGKKCLHAIYSLNTL